MYSAGIIAGYGAMPIDMADANYNIEAEDRNCIDLIIEEKRKLNPWDMVNDTHRLGGAWDQIYKGGVGNHQIISKDLILMAG
jgi:hypothetical protein